MPRGGRKQRSYNGDIPLGDLRPPLNASSVWYVEYIRWMRSVSLKIYHLDRVTWRYMALANISNCSRESAFTYILLDTNIPVFHMWIPRGVIYTMFAECSPFARTRDCGTQIKISQSGVSHEKPWSSRLSSFPRVIHRMRYCYLSIDVGTRYKSF